jgi:hypothetical protein
MKRIFLLAIVATYWHRRLVRGILRPPKIKEVISYRYSRPPNPCELTHHCSEDRNQAAHAARFAGKEKLAVTLALRRIRLAVLGRDALATDRSPSLDLIRVYGT